MYYRNRQGVHYYDRYGFVHFLSDAILTCVTGGLWLIRVYVREKRRNP